MRDAENVTGQATDDEDLSIGVDRDRTWNSEAVAGTVAAPIQDLFDAACWGDAKDVVGGGSRDIDVRLGLAGKAPRNQQRRSAVMSIPSPEARGCTSSPDKVIAKL
jgi:hypothetical protein